MPLDFADRVAVVTGGAAGIGLAVAHGFWSRGARVTILDVDSHAGEVAVAPQANQGLFIHCDVSDAQSVAAAMPAVQEQWGRLDYLVNNAAIQRYGTVTSTDEAEWDAMMAINLKSAFLCAKYAIPLMQTHNNGVIVNIASVQAFLSQDNVAAYTTAKSALLGLTRSIAIDYAPSIRCVAVCPGTIDTPMLHNAAALADDSEQVLADCRAMHLVQRIGTPEEVASLVCYLCSDAAGFITGQSFRVDGGLGIKIAGSPD